MSTTPRDDGSATISAEQFDLIYNLFARMMHGDVEMIRSGELDYDELGSQVQIEYEIWELLKEIRNRSFSTDDSADRR